MIQNREDIMKQEKNKTEIAKKRILSNIKDRKLFYNVKLLQRVQKRLWKLSLIN